MIDASDLTLSYRDGQRRLDAVRGVSIQIGRGEWIALTGSNGSGKSSLVRMFNGLLAPTLGSLQAAGLDMRRPQDRAAVKRHIQLIFQNPEAQTVGSTPYEDVAFGLENRGIPPEEMERSILRVLAQVGLAHKVASAVGTLSGGERQRLAVACCLALEPEMIIFDEATSMLDPAGRTEILRLARELWDQGMTVLWVTQRLEELALSPRAAVMDEGRLIFDGDPRSLFYASGLPERLGWTLPPAVRIGRLLQTKGWALAELPLTEQELEAIL